MEIITKKTNIADLIAKHPETADVLMAFGLHCVGCFASHFDTIEEGAKVHNMLDEEIDEMINELNLIVNKGELDDQHRDTGITDDKGAETGKDDSFVSSTKSKLKIKVKDNCIGCGTCVVIAPKTFEMNDEYKSVVIKDFEDSDETIKEAESSCPVSAIVVKD